MEGEPPDSFAYMLTAKDRNHSACDHEYRKGEDCYDRRHNQQSTRPHEDMGQRAVEQPLQNASHQVSTGGPIAATKFRILSVDSAFFSPSGQP
jgi:hypothetical protein